MDPIYLYVSMFSWILVVLFISEYSRKKLKSGITEFVLGGRRLGGFISAMTYSATTFSSFMMVGLVGLTYSGGVAALGFEMTYLVFTVVFLIIFAPRFWVSGKIFGHITPLELLSERYSRKTGIVAAIICLVMLIPYMSIQMMGVGFLLEGMTNGSIPYIHGVYIVAFLSVVVTIWAGMRSVAFTDALQAALMLASAVILLFYVFYAFFGSPTCYFSTISVENPELLKITWDFNMYLGLTLPWAFFALTNPQVSQRMFITKDVKSLKKMILYFAIFGFIYTIISTLLGLSAANLIPGLANPDSAMPVLLTMVPKLLGLLVFIGIFAASVSTLGSILLTISSIGSRDIVRFINPNISERVEVFTTRVIILVFIFLCVVFASMRLDLIAVLASAASAGLLVMAPSIIGSFFWEKGTEESANISMIVGGLVVLLMYASDSYLLDLWPSVWGLITSTSLFISIGIISGSKDDGSKFICEIKKGMDKYNL